MSFSYLSVCSGLEAASLAFAPLGATAVGFSEIEGFPSAIIAHRHGSNLPGEEPSRNAPPNFGDFTQIPLDALGRVDVLIGGTPCQAFSVAGKRDSLADARGNLTLAFAVLAHELARSHGLRNVVWENVPGALSTDDNAFGCFLGALVGADAALHTPDGGSWPNLGMVAGPRARAAWRILDAQYFGVAQRRRRVFLVADFGRGADPAAVLFEPKGLRGNTSPRREKGEGIAPTIAARARGGGGLGTDFDCEGGLIVSTGDVSHCLNAGGMGRQDFELETLVAHALRGEGFAASEDGTGRGTPLVPVCFDARQSDVCIYGEKAAPLDTDGFSQAVAFDLRGREGGAQFEGPHDTANIRAASGGSSRSYVAHVTSTLPAGGNSSGGDRQPGTSAETEATMLVAERWAVRRLTPRECERLQGVPDNYTAIPWRGKSAQDCPDGPRYKALGNSWAVPVVRWIGERLAAELARVDAARERGL